MFFPQYQINEFQKTLEWKAIIFAIVAIVIFTIVGTASIQFEKASERPNYRPTTLRGLLSQVAGKNITIE